MIVTIRYGCARGTASAPGQHSRGAKHVSSGSPKWRHLAEVLCLSIASRAFQVIGCAPLPAA